VFDEELAPAIEQVSQSDFSFRGIEEIFLFDFYTWKFAAVATYFVTQVR
jgi:hypothetical protein